MDTQTLDTTRAQGDHSTVDRIVIVADDLTGACDSAIPFTVAGWPAKVFLGPGPMPSQPASVSAVDIATRNLLPEQAAERVNRTVSSLNASSPGTLCFLKVDSAARGNMASEVPAALEASATALALVAPAFPATGRTVQSGVLQIRDFTGQNTELDLRIQFPEADLLPTGSVAALRHAITTAVVSGRRILLCNSLTQADLEQLAAAALSVPKPLLWVGSSGLARALAAQLPAPAHQPASVSEPRTGRTILFVGTPHPVTEQQLNHLRLNDSAGSCTVHRVEFTPGSEEQILLAYRHAPVRALILTGGDTAAYVLRTLGATAISLAGELAPGIPYGRIEGGLADGCTVVTKSGGFGQQDALLQAFHLCERNHLATA